MGINYTMSDAEVLQVAQEQCLYSAENPKGPTYICNAINRLALAEGIDMDWVDRLHDRIGSRIQMQLQARDKEHVLFDLYKRTINYRPEQTVYSPEYIIFRDAWIATTIEAWKAEDAE